LIAGLEGRPSYSEGVFLPSWDRGEKVLASISRSESSKGEKSEGHPAESRFLIRRGGELRVLRLSFWAAYDFRREGEDYFGTNERWGQRRKGERLSQKGKEGGEQSIILGSYSWQLWRKKRATGRA